MSNKITVSIDRELGEELVEILRHDVKVADEIGQHENAKLYAANKIDAKLDQ